MEAEAQGMVGEERRVNLEELEDETVSKARGVGPLPVRGISP